MDATDLQTVYGDYSCDFVRNCWFTMCRYSFGDSVGFNYVWHLYQEHPIMFFGAILYLMLTTIGILFGILAIFRAPFTEDFSAKTEDDEHMLHAQLDRLRFILDSRGVDIDRMKKHLEDKLRSIEGHVVYDTPPDAFDGDAPQFSSKKLSLSTALDQREHEEEAEVDPIDNARYQDVSLSQKSSHSDSSQVVFRRVDSSEALAADLIRDDSDEDYAYSPQSTQSDLSQVFTREKSDLSPSRDVDEL
jgi:hypothetical protein